MNDSHIWILMVFQKPYLDSNVFQKPYLDSNVFQKPYLDSNGIPKARETRFGSLMGFALTYIKYESNDQNIWL
jgi:hypothetical protein